LQGNFSSRFWGEDPVTFGIAIHHNGNVLTKPVTADANSNTWSGHERPAAGVARNNRKDTAMMLLMFVMGALGFALLGSFWLCRDRTWILQSFNEAEKLGIHPIY